MPMPATPTTKARDNIEISFAVSFTKKEMNATYIQGLIPHSALPKPYNETTLLTVLRLKNDTVKEIMTNPIKIMLFMFSLIKVS